MSLLQHIKGDRGIWGVLIFLSIISFLPVYSASSYLVNVRGVGTTSGYLIKHAFIVFSGMVLVYIFHKIPYRYFSGGSVLAMPFVLLLMIYTLSQGTVIAGATAARWIVIPLIGVSFQSSTLASIVVLIFTARYFARRKDKPIEYKESLLYLWIPVGLVIATILPPNLSSASLLFFYVSVLSLLAGYPFKFWLRIAGLASIFMIVFLFVGYYSSTRVKNKILTWENRITTYIGVENSKDKKEKKYDREQYQIEHALKAIATGGLFGNGAGKSKQRNFLPQSNSDFIYAIIVEEYGLFGAFIVILAYMWLLFRFFVVAKKAKSVFATLLVIGVGFPIVFQAIIHMLVATHISPVTGQNLPILSSGGSSVWMTCIAIGIVLGVSAANEDESLENTEPQENPLDILYETVE